MPDTKTKQINKTGRTKPVPYKDYMNEEKEKGKLCKFKVLAGKHFEGTDEDGNLKCYFPEDIVESKSNLLRLNGISKGTQKFELVSGNISVYPIPKKIRKRSSNPIIIFPSDGLGDLSLKELVEHANNEEIPLTGSETRDRVLEIIRNYLNPT